MAKSCKCTGASHCSCQLARRLKSTCISIVRTLQRHIGILRSLEDRTTFHAKQRRLMCYAPCGTAASFCVGLFLSHPHRLRSECCCCLQTLLQQLTKEPSRPLKSPQAIKNKLTLITSLVCWARLFLAVLQILHRLFPREGSIDG